MKIEEVVWLRDVVDKLSSKHAVSQDEVEDVLESHPKLRFVEKGNRKGENVYEALMRAVTWWFSSSTRRPKPL